MSREFGTTGGYVSDAEDRDFMLPGVYLSPPVSITPPTGRMKVWNGSAWVLKPSKVWSGSTWATKPVKVWNGSAWI